MGELVLISGGTRGLGRALALEFGAAGYAVRALYRSGAEAAEALQTLFRERGIDGICLPADVTGDLSALRAQLGGDPDVLIHNATASFCPRPFHLLGWEELSAQLDVAVKGAFQLSQLVIGGMVRRRRGTIVTLATAATVGPAPKGFAAYLPAKYALLGLSSALAAEYGARGVRTFSVSPGFMETPLTAAWDERMQAMMRGSEPAVRVDHVAAFVRRLVEAPGTPGQGENHLVPAPSA